MCTFWSAEHDDLELDKMAENFCRIAHFEEHENDQVKKQELKGEFQKAAKHV